MMTVVLVLIVIAVIFDICIAAYLILGDKKQGKNWTRLIAEVKEVKFRILKQLTTDKKGSSAQVPNVEYYDDEELYEKELDDARKKQEL